MALLVDSGILFAYYDRKDHWHAESRQLLDAEENLVLPAPILPETDYLLATRVGKGGQLALYDDLVLGVYTVSNLSPLGYRRVYELNQQYADLRLGFVDAAVITIAEELGIGRIATTDRRHFGVVKAKIPLILLPELLTTP
jgi:predicted nucleic acid-binding protein